MAEGTVARWCSACRGKRDKSGCSRLLAQEMLPYLLNENKAEVCDPRLKRGWLRVNGKNYAELCKWGALLTRRAGVLTETRESSAGVTHSISHPEEFEPFLASLQARSFLLRATKHSDSRLARTTSDFSYFRRM